MIEVSTKTVASRPGLIRIMNVTSLTKVFYFHENKRSCCISGFSVWRELTIFLPNNVSFVIYPCISSSRQRSLIRLPRLGSLMLDARPREAASTSTARRGLVTSDQLLRQRGSFGEQIPDAEKSLKVIKKENISKGRPKYGRLR